MGVGSRQEETRRDEVKDRGLGYIRGLKSIRVGIGYDVHAFAQDRRLILGGVDIPYERGLLGHSDADVLTHAIMDALLGALALGDLGKHFPDDDQSYKNASSLGLLGKVIDLIREEGYQIGNIDSIIVAQRPKLAPYIAEMRSKLAAVLGVVEEAVSIKATTTEHLGFEGREEGISAQAIISLIKMGEVLHGSQS